MADHKDAADTKNASLSSSTSSIGRTPPPALKMSSSPSPHTSHRSSFADHMRGAPTSPRASRQPSLTQQALQDLLNNPPTKGSDSQFNGRDWKTVRLREIVDPEVVRFVEYDTSVEDATSVRSTTTSPCCTLDADLHRYLSRTVLPMLSSSARTPIRVMPLVLLTIAT
jgi:hypothetical protein